MENHILVRYGELSLKKSNRKQFIRQVNRHIQKTLTEFPLLKFQSRGMRYYIILNGTNPSLLIPLIQKVPGIHSMSVVSFCKSDLSEIKALSKEILLSELGKGFSTFKVDTNRADKRIPMTSLAISQEIARYLFQEIPGLKADMHKPELTLSLDVREEGTYLFTSIIPGLGGFPASIQGRGLAMVSGGIDSVVAGYLAIKKGIELEAIHFASPPYTSDNALQKVVDLLELLTPYTLNGQILLHVVPFTKIQQLIYEHVREDYGITVMRRLMYRISERLAKRIKALTLINGESVGQVASQTLESINVISRVINIPVIRPLAMMDKQEIVDISKVIGSYDISIRPYDDCCTVFVPKHPQIKPRDYITDSEEQKINIEELIEEAMKAIQTIVLTNQKHYQVIGPIDLF